ncbi:MAG: hypothetical protein GEV28_00470 [Actinophytocola sp.]|uniref:DUF6223 family protein n=1 Tax=Actinophytocola sp. TaxID=1872138 RepID=UPI00132AF485|nr:DUF6223 family protein [Actinophytocola sp.]MPZ78943.1 hypothetical protein [Actinophytocola sp.]
MSVRHLLAAAAAGLLGVFALATPAAAQVLVQSADVDAYTLTAARLWATLAALLGLVGAVIGGLALARSVRRIGDGGRKGAIVALASGLIAVVVGALNLAVADGGPGTGNGVVGGALALVLGLVAMVLGGLALARSRRTADRLTAASRRSRPMPS